MEDYLSEKEQWEWLKTQVRESGVAWTMLRPLGFMSKNRLRATR